MPAPALDHARTMLANAIRAKRGTAELAAQRELEARLKIQLEYLWHRHARAIRCDDPQAVAHCEERILGLERSLVALEMLAVDQRW